jgi:hypothetical protein
VHAARGLKAVVRDGVRLSAQQLEQLGVRDALLGDAAAQLEALVQRHLAVGELQPACFVSIARE